MSENLPLSPLGFTPCLSIEETDQGREFWLSKVQLDEETKANLLSSDILMVPEGEDYRDKGPFFPEGTLEFFHFLQVQGASVEIAADDASFNELTRHFNLYILGEFIVKDVALPIFVGLMLKYLENRLLNSEKSAIKLGLACQKPG